MKSLNKLQLTYIPSNYWNDPLSGFKIKSKEINIPKNVNFFILWSYLTESEEELINQLQQIFPKIPVKKLITCQIRLAFPLELPKIKNEKNDSNKYFRVNFVLGKLLPISPAVKLLYKLEIIEDYDRKIYYSNSLKTWALLTKFIFELLNRGNFVPILVPITDKEYKGQWRLLLTTQNDNERYKTILNNSPWSCFNIPINFISNNGTLKNLTTCKTDGLWHPSYIFSNYMDDVGDLLVRTTLKKSKFQTFNEFYRIEIEKEKNKDYLLGWDYKFLKSLIMKKSNFKIEKLHETIIPKIVKNWVQIIGGWRFTKGFSFILELKYPKEPENYWPLKFYLTLQDDMAYIPLNELWEKRDKYKKAILKFFKNEEELFEAILRALGTASKIFSPLIRGLEGKIPQEVALSSNEVMEFLRFPKDLLIQRGFNVILPDVFTSGGKQRLSARLIIDSKEKKTVKKGTSTTLPSLFDINSMLEYKWEATLEGIRITGEEFNDLINSDESLINWRGKWILIDQQEVENLRNIKNSGTISYMEALKLGLTGNIQLQENGNKYEVVLKGDFSKIVEKLQTLETFEKIPIPNSFNGTLRPYQKKALTWMGNMCEFNFGLCLADDMGLGKTIQIIAYLLYRKEKDSKESNSTLIICPTSILFNWFREINKFAPDLEVILHHGPNRVKNVSGIKKYLKPHQIILTSFGTLRNDIDFLQIIPFNGIIVDESQNIKNYSSQQTQAILNLQSNFRICLSGTPLENRLIELWTLFEFLNPGLLGTRTEFLKKFVIPIERFQDQEAINKLKLVISPFILRRVKTDKSIINDLPEKNEIKIYVELTDQQEKLYKEVVDKTLKEIETTSSDKRKKRGIILKLLTHLKQLCNHPNQYLKIKEIGSDIGAFLSESQKMERLLEMTDEIISNTGKILIFTQFKQMGDLIKKTLELKYPFEILYFHGSVPENKRREIVDEFQSADVDSSPILILSLKAGGTGLNLTQGTTVIHFDSPWNPAIQDQATDRAYRIGQKFQVNVYKFITVGTIEEKIDKLLEEKRDLADKIIISSGESWISNLNDEKLRDLFTLNI